MKKKGARDIPDFSSKKSGKIPLSQMLDAKTKPTVHTPPPNAKPPATSMKSGRRGS